MPKSPAWTVLSRIGGFVFFLLLLVIANILIPSINNQSFADIISFLNANIFLLLAITFLGMVNDIFWNSSLPINLLAPVSSTILSIYLIMFFYAFWIFLDASYFRTCAQIPIAGIYVIIPFFTLVICYLVILARGGQPAADWREKMERKKMERKTQKDKVEWDDIGYEFKLALFNLGRSLNKALRGKEGKKKGKN
jgi:hypothetical protein